MREKKLNKHSSFETWHRVFFSVTALYFLSVKFIVGYMFCIWAFVPFVAEEMLTPRVVLDIFLLKNYLSSTSNYLDRCCVQKKNFHYSHRQKTNTLWTAVNKICGSSFFFLFETWHAFCTFFIDFSLSLIESYFLVIFSVPFIWRSVHNSTWTSNRIIAWWRFSSFLVKQRHQALFEYLRVSGISWKITIFSRITNWNTRKYINISPQYSRVEVIFCGIHRTLNLYTLMSNRYCLFIIVSTKPS